MHRYEGTPAALKVDQALSARNERMSEVAGRIGIKPNLLSMVRHGAAAIPPRRCAAFAAALGIDPLEMMVACVRSYTDNRSWDAVGLVVGMRDAG